MKHEVGFACNKRLCRFQETEKLKSKKKLKKKPHQLYKYCVRQYSEKHLKALDCYSL